MNAHCFDWTPANWAGVKGWKMMAELSASFSVMLEKNRLYAYWAKTHMNICDPGGILPISYLFTHRKMLWLPNLPVALLSKTKTYHQKGQKHSVNWNPQRQKIDVLFFFLTPTLFCRGRQALSLVYRAVCAQETAPLLEGAQLSADFPAVGLLIIPEDLTVNQHRWPERWAGMTRVGKREKKNRGRKRES